MLFSGTLIAAGTGRGVVAATGAGTEIGRISGMLGEVETLTTPLVVQMDRFALAHGLHPDRRRGCFAYGYFVGHMPFADLFMAVVGLSVAAIPEGLPAVLTITLAVGVQAMARRNAIVRRLPAIETLGSVSVICSDKTGTLTRNEMMAHASRRRDMSIRSTARATRPRARCAGRRPDAHPDEHAVLMEFARPRRSATTRLHEAENAWRVEGDPMEGALKALAGKITGDGPSRSAAGPARTRSPSTPRTATWPRCTTTPRAGRGSTSRARRRRCWRSAPTSARRAAAPRRWTKGTGTAWSRSSPPRASG
jgi:magnesium-transporting ATPase (P-type)